MIPTPLGRISKDLRISKAELRGIVRRFHLEMSKGLLCKESSLKMIPTYVDRPTGNEKGRFIALDLGGTNFRVLSLMLKGNGTLSDIRTLKSELKKEDIATTGERLFDLLSAAIKKFIKENNISSYDKLPLGFTFSFPVEQTDIDRGRLVAWTKGFRASGVKGRDVVGLLERSLKKKGVGSVSVAALVNDTVGTLVARSYGDRSCDVGVIIGTGTNACYVEDLRRIKKLKGRWRKPGTMIINIEWGNFNKLKVTSYDKELDASSSNPGFQMLEKMVSGMYLGEICTLIVKRLIRENRLFDGASSKNTYSEIIFKSEEISHILADRSSGLAGVESLLRKAGVRHQSIEDRKMIKRVCGLVTLRAARISAAAIFAVVTKIDPGLKKAHTIAIDGTIYEKLPGFAGNIIYAIKELSGRSAGRINITLTKDGSGRGAAIVAAIAAG